MTENQSYEIISLAQLFHIPVYQYAGKDQSGKFMYTTNPDFQLTEKMLRKMIDLAASQKMPFLFQAVKHIYFGCIPLENEVKLLVGPVATQSCSFRSKWRFIKEQKLVNLTDIQFAELSVSKLAGILSLMFCILTGRKISRTEIIENSQVSQEISPEYKKKEQKIGLEDDERYHHTMATEQLCMDAIKRGDGNSAKNIMMQMLDSAGVLTTDGNRQLLYLYIAGVTLETRAVMSVGVPPAEAYRLSDELIRKADGVENADDLVYLLLNSVDLMIDLIHTEDKRRKYSGCIEQCRQYLEKNYKQKFSLKELSEYTGFNGSYLSHHFADVYGITLVEYLNRVRIDKARNLLKFAPNSILEISNYLGFQSQSYFGKIFKKETGMTPQQYRNCYQIKEFSMRKEK